MHGLSSLKGCGLDSSKQSFNACRRAAAGVGGADVTNVSGIGTGVVTDRQETCRPEVNREGDRGRQLRRQFADGTVSGRWCLLLFRRSFRINVATVARGFLLNRPRHRQYAARVDRDDDPGPDEPGDRDENAEVNTSQGIQFTRLLAAGQSQRYDEAKWSPEPPVQPIASCSRCCSRSSVG